MKARTISCLLSLLVVPVLVSIAVAAGPAGFVESRYNLPIYVSEGDNYHVTPLLDMNNAPEAKVFVSHIVMKPGTKVPAHDHGDTWEAHYIISGSAKFTIGDKESRATPGSFVYLPPHVPHQLINDLDENLVTILIYSPAGGPADGRFFKWPTWGEAMQKAQSGNVLK